MVLKGLKRFRDKNSRRIRQMTIFLLLSVVIAILLLIVLVVGVIQGSVVSNGVPNHTDDCIIER